MCIRDRCLLDVDGWKKQFYTHSMHQRGTCGLSDSKETAVLSHVSQSHRYPHWKGYSLDGGPSQGWVSALLRKKTKIIVVGFLRIHKASKRKKRDIKNWILVLGTWLVSAAPDLLFHAYLLALLHSGRHESTTVCFLLLCAGPIEGCSAVHVLAVRRYYGFRSLVCASWCSEQKKVQKQKLRCLCSLEVILLAELMIQLALPPRRALPQQSCSPCG